MTGFTNTERLALFTQLRAFESDFDKSQSQIRAICAAWSGVVLGAIALLVTNAVNPPSGSFDVEIRAATLAILRCVICIVGSVGVYAFWFIDQRIYQRLLHSVFAYGLHTEFSNADLPQLRSSMFIANLDVTNGLAWFYRTQFFVFLAISIIFFVGDESIKTAAAPQMNLMAFSLVLSHLIIAVIGEWSSRKWSSLRELVDEIYPALGAVMPVHRRPAGKVRIFDFGLLFGSDSKRAPADNESRRTNWLARVGASPVPLEPDIPPAPQAP